MATCSVGIKQDNECYLENDAVLCKFLSDKKTKTRQNETKQNKTNDNAAKIEWQM